MKKYRKNQTLPKAWQKKKKSGFSTGRTKSLTDVKHTQSKYKNLIKMKGSRQLLKWRLPGLFLGLGIVIILAIPTLIVLPYIQDDGSNEMTITNEGKSAAPAADAKKAAKEPSVSVAVMRSDTNKIEDVPLETYVSRVVASEMPAKFELEALKAQALAARTNIVNLMLHQKDNDKPDISDSTSDQVYQNETELRNKMGNDYNQKMAKIDKAVKETKGQILTYKGMPIFPAFFSTSNGYTENSEDYWSNELPYLRSVASPWDKDSPKFLDQEVFSKDEIENKLGIDITKKTSINLVRTDSHRVKEMKIAGKTYSGKDVREKLGLRSSDFTIEQKNKHFIFTTKGYGHGIGMSQYGANGMAKEGKNYQDIVKYYYKDVTISNIAEATPTLASAK